MNEAWFRRSDWPMDWEIERRKALMDAVRSLSNNDPLSEIEIEECAMRLWLDAQFALNNSRNHNQPASQKASEKELERLHDLCEKLSQHILSMHEPAITALHAYSDDLVLEFGKKAAHMREAARVAFSDVEGRDVRGRKLDVAVSQLALSAGSMYLSITRKRPTLTTDTVSGEVSGTWPDFLDAIFKATYTRASVASQSRAVSEIMRDESLH